MEDLTVRPIEYGFEEYKEELKLRDKILRQPLGLDLFKEDLSGENKDIHIGAFVKDMLVGVLVLTPINDKKIKMRQVAVNEAYRRQKIGAAMVEYAETLSLAIGISEILLHARTTAVRFYEKLGYAAAGQEFTEIGIPHVMMVKRLSF